MSSSTQFHNDIVASTLKWTSAGFTGTSIVYTSLTVVDYCYSLFKKFHNFATGAEKETPYVGIFTSSDNGLTHFKKLILHLGYASVIYLVGVGLAKTEDVYRK